MDVEVWSELYAAAEVEWLSGREDLLSIIGLRKHELTHSAVIEWLLTPTARHGLGSRVLDSIFLELWPDERPLEGLVAVDTEVGRTVGGDHARADIVAWIGDTILVIENKLDAVEQPRQAERLYLVWEQESSDVRWLFLSPDGRMPTSAGPDAVRRQWRALGYPLLAGIIAEAIADAEPSATTGRRSAEQYAATLQSLYGSEPMRSETPQPE